jgi:AraC-like DNA-binding protein/mannose-6-phosphate isomerase-like protein (cupin superfamily)
MSSLSSCALGEKLEIMQATANRTEFHRPRYLNGLELVSACYQEMAFPAHAHPEIVIGAIVSGAEQLVVGRHVQTLKTGDTLFLHPEEVHANASIGDAPLRYQVLYIPQQLLRDACAGDGRDVSLLCFDRPFSCLPSHYDMILRCHAILRVADDALTQQSVFCELAAGLTRAFSRAGNRNIRIEHPKIRTARDYLHAHFRDNPSLATLAAIAGLSPYYLLRTFKRQIGLSPVAYRNLLRVMAVRLQLQRGASLTDAALEAGFADQSHMTRAFRLVMGDTPGRYARQ